MRNAMSSIIGQMAKVDIPTGNWPELLERVNTTTHSTNIQEREVNTWFIYRLGLSF